MEQLYFLVLRWLFSGLIT